MMRAGATGTTVSRGAGCKPEAAGRSSMLRAQGDFLLKARARVRVVAAAALVWLIRMAVA